MEGDQRIVEEFYSLLERTQQLFSGLRFFILYSFTVIYGQFSFISLIFVRDVPHFGKQWQPYFQRTFEVYTKVNK